MASEIKEDGVNSGSPGLEKSEKSNSSVQNCVLCGCSTPAVRCDKCNSQTFCLSCDDMYHRHPKRRLHLRKAVDSIWNSHRSPRLRKSTNLPGDPSKIPIPPPRRRKRERFNTFTGVSFPKTPFDISAIARRDSWTSKLHGVSKSNAIVSKSAVGGYPQERNAIEPSYENSSSFHEQNLQSDSSINGTTHEPMEQIDIDKKQTQQSVSNGNIKNSHSTEMDQFSNIHMADAMHVPVSPTAVVHDENQDGRTAGYPAQMYSRGSHISHSAADLRSMPMSPHFFYPPPHPAIPHHIHPFSPSVAHMNCSQCVSASWSNLMSPHLPPYHLQPQWNSANSTLSRKRHASGIEGQIKSNQTPLDSSGYPVSHVPFATPVYPYVGSPFYPHGYPAAESPTLNSQTPVDMQRNAKCSSLSPRISQCSDRQEESDQMLASAQSNGGEKERPEVEEKQVAEKAEELESEEDDNADEHESVSIVPEKPNEPWSCIHCTYINPPGCHICEVCCKTSYVAPQKVTKKKKKQEQKSDLLLESAYMQGKDSPTSSPIVAADDMMQIDSEQHFPEDPEKVI